MKKTYHIPSLRVTRIETQLLIADSPNVTINRDSDGIAAEAVDVKGSSSRYNVWDDDWSK